LEINAINPSEAVALAGKLTRSLGAKVMPRGLECREVVAVTMVIERPWQLPLVVPGREMRDFISAAEIIGLLGQTALDAVIMKKCQSLYSFTDRGVMFGAYGTRIRGQWSMVLDELRKDHDSRRAVMTIYDGRSDLGRDVKDIPCTLSFQFLIRDDKLNMITTMRSNDVYRGLPYDLMQFGALLCATAQVLGLQPGTYYHRVGSFHLYETDVPHVNRIHQTVPRYMPYVPLFSFDDEEYITIWCQQAQHPEPTLVATPFEEFLLTAIREG